ncbi:MAG: YlxR family protein [bacterium]
MHIPIRMCVGCLRKRPKVELLRFVISDGQIKIGNASGKGFYLCPDRNCLELATRRAFMRDILSKVSRDELENAFVTSFENMIDWSPGLGVICGFRCGGVTLE